MTGNRDYAGLISNWGMTSMSDNVQTLVRMANQIADAFLGAPHEEAVAGVANHIKSFWAPVMRNRLFDYATSHAAEFRPLALEGIAVLRKGVAAQG